MDKLPILKIDPEFKDGETITLDGEQAEKYVRKL